MALDLESDVPNTNPASADYPFGSFKDSTSPGAFNGTPAIAKWANDFWGFFQKLLSNANVLPNNMPDTVQLSQYFNSLVATINQRAGLFIGQIYPIDTSISNPDLVKRGFIPCGLSLTGANVTALNLSAAQKTILTNLVADPNNLYVTAFVDNTTLTTKSLEERYERIDSTLAFGDTSLEDQIQNITGTTLLSFDVGNAQATGVSYSPTGSFKLPPITTKNRGAAAFEHSEAARYGIDFDASGSAGMRTGTYTRPKSHVIKNKGIFIGFNEGFLL
jgi:hypothetical protein